jgi:hypothetical protein
MDGTTIKSCEPLRGGYKTWGKTQCLQCLLGKKAHFPCFPFGILLLWFSFIMLSLVLDLNNELKFSQYHFFLMERIKNVRNITFRVHDFFFINGNQRTMVKNQVGKFHQGAKKLKW